MSDDWRGDLELWLAPFLAAILWISAELAPRAHSAQTSEVV
jgi:hypothetical protein